MIKAIFFDLYLTLVDYWPPRQELQAKALKELGYNIDPEDLIIPLTIADEFMFEEHARLSLGKRSQKEQGEIYLKYEEIILREAGLKVAPEVPKLILEKISKVNLKTVPFDDTIPVLRELKEKGYITGLISNVADSISSMLDGLGLKLFLDLVVTSKDAGFNKPDPAIFLKAVEMAGTSPNETMFVGDQYNIDVIGAQNAGLRAVLLDRVGHFSGQGDFIKVNSLYELSGKIEQEV